MSRVSKGTGVGYGSVAGSRAYQGASSDAVGGETVSITEASAIGGSFSRSFSRSFSGGAR